MVSVVNRSLCLVFVRGRVILEFLGIVNRCSIRPCVTDGLLGVVTGRVCLLCSKTVALRFGICHTQGTPVHQWTTRPSTIHQTTALDYKLTRCEH
jgi:hypothetical protein